VSSGETVLHVGKVSGIAGSEAHLLTLLPDLRERGWDARFCLLHEGEPGALEFRRRLVDTGVPVEAVQLARDLDPRAFTRLIRVVRRTRPTLLHTHLVHGDAYGLPAGKLARVPVLASTKHGFNFFRERRVFALADRALARLVDLHIAISDGLARYLAETEGLDPGSFEIVHYGIAPGPEPAPPPHEPRVVCVGRLVRIKGHEVLLRAFAAAREANPGLALEIVGDGPLRSQLEQQAQRLGVAEHVTFSGWLPSIAPAFERAAVVVVPSLGEGFGMVALEAAERGRAVIASAVGGLPEIVDDGRTGALVPTADAAALAAAIGELAADPERSARLGAAARERALREFSLARCADRTVELYRAVLARRSSQRSSAAAASSASTKSHGTR
jgi:glycosyltransferase involved in cell wall biosynthesis